MLSELKNNKSLSFYKPSPLSAISTDYSISSEENGTEPQNGLMLQNINTNVGKNVTRLSDNKIVYEHKELKDSVTSPINIMSAAGNIYIAHDVGVTVTGFNKQCNDFITSLSQSREDLKNQVIERLAKDPAYKGLRRKGVELAWEYEKADIEMGGSGSANWDESQKQEILERGSVRGAEGHHQKNVSDHPCEQANPDNIKFYKSKNEHLNQGHDGDFRNETNGEMIDKEKMLRRTNQQRVFKKELTGLAAAVAIGVGISFTISFITELAKNGLTMENTVGAFITAGKSGIEMGAVTAVSYTAGRLAAYGLEKAFEIAAERLFSQAAVGILSVTVFSAYQFVKLKLKGADTLNAFKATAKQALFSVSMLAVSLAIGSKFGHPAALIVSLSIGTVVLLVNVVQSVRERKLEEKLRACTAEQNYQNTLRKVGMAY